MEHDLFNGIFLHVESVTDKEMDFDFFCAIKVKAV
jgi:hypothetical protein